MTTRATHPFWLDAYDAGAPDTILACPHWPDHRWVTVRADDLLTTPVLWGHDPDDQVSFCSGCYVLRCPKLHRDDRCTLYAAHLGHHLVAGKTVE